MALRTVTETSLDPAALAAAIVDNLPDAPAVQASCESAIDAKLAAIAAAVAGAVPDASAIEAASSAAIAAAAGADIPTATQNAAAIQNIPATQGWQWIDFSVTGVGTSGTVLAAQGAGVVIDVMGFLITCSAVASVFSFSSTGGDTMRAQQGGVGTAWSWGPSLQRFFRGGANASLIVNKTSTAVLTGRVLVYIHS